MPTTFKDQQKMLTEAQHQLAVWEALYRFLDENFIARNGNTPKKAIKANDCLIQVVPEDTLEEILKVLEQEKITPLQHAIQTINNQEVVVMSSGDN